MEGSNKACNNLRLCIISGNFVQVHHLLYLPTFNRTLLKSKVKWLLTFLSLQILQALLHNCKAYQFSPLIYAPEHVCIHRRYLLLLQLLEKKIQFWVEYFKWSEHPIKKKSTHKMLCSSEWNLSLRNLVGILQVSPVWDISRALCSWPQGRLVSCSASFTFQHLMEQFPWISPSPGSHLSLPSCHLNRSVVFPISLLPRCY